MRQIVGILIDNAIRYSHTGSVVVISAGVIQTEAGPHAEITVRDRGIGIPRDDLAHVFDRQYRAANARRHRPDGTGLGLSLARDLARRHGGDITIDSDGAGTCARLTLPIQAAEAGPPVDGAGAT
jgi:signal transduction histidine kinase